MNKKRNAFSQGGGVGNESEMSESVPTGHRNNPFLPVEKYGTSPLLPALEDVRRLNEVSEAIRVAESAAFVKERIGDLR